MYFQTFDTDVLDKIKERLRQSHSLMTETESYFLNGIIRYYKPKKVLEIGVASGTSSAVILNAIKDIEGAKLYSVDLSQRHYTMKNKQTGFAVEEFFPELSNLNKWELKTGKLVHEFIDEIGDGIDLCLIDTIHERPGEILDYLMVLPYLSPNCVVVSGNT